MASVVVGVAAMTDVAVGATELAGVDAGVDAMRGVAVGVTDMAGVDVGVDAMTGVDVGVAATTDVAVGVTDTAGVDIGVAAMTGVDVGVAEMTGMDVGVAATKGVAVGEAAMPGVAVGVAEMTGEDVGALAGDEQARDASTSASSMAVAYLMVSAPRFSDYTVLKQCHRSERASSRDHLNPRIHPTGVGRPRRPCTVSRTRPCRARSRVGLSDPPASSISSYDLASNGSLGLYQVSISRPMTASADCRQRTGCPCRAGSVQHKTAIPTGAKNTFSDVRPFTASSDGSPSDPSSCRRSPGQSEPRSFPEPLNPRKTPGTGGEAGLKHEPPVLPDRATSCR